MMTTIIVLAVFINIAMAGFDYYRISNNKKINHTVNAIVYTALAALCAYLFANLWYIIPMLLLRPVVFDVLLNVFRGLNPFHVSLTTTSVIDKWEVKLLGTRGWLHWLVWLGLSIVSIVILNLVK